ncbi:MAG: hypothetical protein M9947_04545 [Thermomicrobiales bacterium]|nr:hypothetical protein [Thermomicrobiales bacterium]
MLVAVIAAAFTGVFIYSIGHLLLHFADHSVTQELRRQELWIGLVLTFGILAVASFLARRSAHGRLDKQVAIGKSPMSGELNLDPIPLSAKYGPEGTVADLSAGYTLYARNGAFGETIDVLKSVEDIGGIQRTLIYAKGLYGGQNELWIPIEAVSGVYPESKSAFLAIGGDEAETFGWNRPPAAFSRVERPKETPLY